jgi:hypothetical protein
MSNATSFVSLNTSSDNPFMPLLKRAYYDGMMDRWINAGSHASILLQSCAADIAACQQNGYSLSELFFINDDKKRYRMTHEDTNKMISSTFQCMKKKEKTLYSDCTSALAYATRLDLAHPVVYELPHDIPKTEQEKLASKALQSFGKFVPQISTAFHACRDSLHEKTCKSEAYVMARYVRHGNFQAHHIDSFLKCLRSDLQYADTQCIYAIDHLDHLIRPDPTAMGTGGNAGQSFKNAAAQTKPRDPHDGIGFVIFIMIAMLYAYLYAYHKRALRMDRRIIHPRPQQGTHSRPQYAEQTSSTKKKEISFQLEDDVEEQQSNNILDNATESSSLLLFDEFTSTTTKSTACAAGTNNSNHDQSNSFQQTSSSSNNKPQPVYGVWETLS